VSLPADALPSLNPALDRDALAREFAQLGRLHVPGLFTPASAARIHACLQNETPYGLSLNIDGAPRGLRGLTPQQQWALTQKAWSQVGLEGFRFLYDGHQLSLNGEPYADPAHYWAKVLAFLNGPEFLDLARAITGFDRIAFADAQATLYRSGHFLTAHDDEIEGTNRLAAYVISFTTAWRPEWGGLLEFIDGRHNIAAGYLPDFNSLKLFRIPMTHHVSMVAPFATTGRYSITGWLRAR
jgi:hypothetical protein